ncbi:MAG: M20/M25/M40 family metallo-hydrolase, partial [Pirellulaceae bacterium]|nr:M20/M25/M40 family metallo-hydrolase [Pirellulaceae bacterium]
EYLSDRLPNVGRGLAVFEVAVRRDGQPVHEVLGGSEQPSVIHAGAALILALQELDAQLSQLVDPLAGRESVFVGQAHGGEIFNQAPVLLEFSGTRRWLDQTDAIEAKEALLELLHAVAAESNVSVEVNYQIIRDAFRLDARTEFPQAFQRAYTAVAGEPLPVGAKPFVDDANAFIRRGGVPAITHGPNATGAHTVDEKCPVAELVRVAQVYALTAIEFCPGP